MRMSRHDAAKNRERVLRTASEMFRKDGYDGTGIAALMKASGMTNGAFYKQFDSKEALIAEATAQALTENCRGLDQGLGQGRGRSACRHRAMVSVRPASGTSGQGSVPMRPWRPRRRATRGSVRKAFDDGLRRTRGNHLRA